MNTSKEDANENSYQNDILKYLGKELIVMELCPTMDLLLLATNKEVWTHRADIEDWNRVKTLTPSSDTSSSLSSVCWFSDGLSSSSSSSSFNSLIHFFIYL